MRRFPYYYLKLVKTITDVAPKRSVIFAVIEATFTDGFQFAFAIPCASVATVIASIRLAGNVSGKSVLPRFTTAPGA